MEAVDFTQQDRNNPAAIRDAAEIPRQRQIMMNMMITLSLRSGLYIAVIGSASAIMLAIDKYAVDASVCLL